jgi:O-antigen ligase
VFLLILLFIFETVRIRWVDLSLISRDMVLLFWGAVALSALGLSLAIWDVPGMWGEYNRFKGFTPNATVAAWIATFVFPIGYARAFTVTGQARNWLVIGTAILGIAVIASGTRGALLALLGTVVLVHVIRKSHWAVGSGVSAVLIFAIGLAFNLFGTRPSEALDTNPSEASRPSLLEGLAGRVPEPSTDISSGRLDLWETGLGFWADKPLIGWGFGATDSLKGLSGTSLHNAYLTTLVETGVLGLALLAALLFWVFFWQVRPDAGIIAAGAAVLVNAALASSLVNLGSPLTLGAWLVLGALLAAGRRAAQAPQLGATSLVGVPTPSPG